MTATRKGGRKRVENAEDDDKRVVHAHGMGARVRGAVLVRLRGKKDTIRYTGRAVHRRSPHPHTLAGGKHK